MASPLSHNSSILIIGGGTWGCSAALHLTRRGYKSVTVLDAYPVPSPISAGNDINKFLETGTWSADAPGQKDAEEEVMKRAIDGWLNDPIFKKYYHETGIVLSAVSDEGKRSLENDGLSEAGGWTKLTTKEQFRATMPEGILTGDFPGWAGWYRKDGAGWVHARKSMESAAAEAKRLGAVFITGESAGKVERLIYEGDDIKGAVTADCKEHRADRTILSAGANSALLFDFKDQLRPTAWTLQHIKMTPEEAKKYANLPVLFNMERGFFIEPDEDKHELKVVDEHPGYCNWIRDPQDSSKKRSVPFARHQVPKEAEKRARDFLSETAPHLADRPFSFARICWCVDTPDRAFLISKHPDYPSLVLATGDSGHGFCHITSVGGFIADAMEDRLSENLKNHFRWRPETAVNRDWSDLQSRMGPPGSNRIMDFQEVDGWATYSSSRPSRL